MSSRRARGDDEINLHLEELGCERGLPILATVRVSPCDEDVLTFDEAVIAQPLEEYL